MTESAARSMRAVIGERTSRSAGWAFRTAVFSAVLLAVAGLAHRQGLIETPPFLQLLLIVGVLALLGLLMATVALLRIWRRGDRGALSAVTGVVVAVAVLVPFGVSFAQGFLYPPLYDVATDLDDPPAFSLAEKERTAGMNALKPISASAAEAQAKAYPGVAARRYEYPRERVVQAVEALIAERGWRVLGRIESAEDGHPVTIEAVARTFLLGFKSDVAIRVFDDDSATYVDMRSASHYGRHDLGDNARRITAFLSDLDDRMTALAGQ